MQQGYAEASKHSVHIDAYLLGGSATAAAWAEALIYRQTEYAGKRAASAAAHITRNSICCKQRHTRSKALQHACTHSLHAGRDTVAQPRQARVAGT